MKTSNMLLLKKLNVAVPLLGIVGVMASLFYYGSLDPIPNWADWLVILIVPFGALAVNGAIRLNNYKKRLS